MFGKKKKMVDVRELQRRGIVCFPKSENIVPTNSDGFVDVRSEVISPKKSAMSLFYGKSTAQKEIFSAETEGYNKREVDAKMTDLDNKIYKLEQRIELLEKKLGVSQLTYLNSSPLANW
ncbi:MAG: hypothetical protein Q8N88_00335 [Nanoarchaeota archaeon]|nr:hypothetical protein [Nanoarchaeota archaeon]